MKLRQLALASALCTVAATGARAATVAVDVGHFLAKPGATSAYGVPEFEYNHSLAAVIALRLANEGVGVRLIGHRGELADLPARPREAEEGGAGFLLSVLDGKGWDTKTQCEDIEFTLNAVAEGHRAVLEPRAVFFDEQPAKQVGVPAVMGACSLFGCLDRFFQIRISTIQDLCFPH